MFRRLLPFIAFLAVVAAALAWALTGARPDVVCYTSVDDFVAGEILKRFEAETGLRVRIVSDTEATKTIGLATRLLEERSRPAADVFWNNEPAWTVRLAGQGVLEAYDSPAARDVPPAWKDPKGFWTANGLRARVLILHSPSVKDGGPRSFRDLADPRFRGKAALARPLAGTALSHLAALRSLLGEAEFGRWFDAAVKNGLSFASGNGAVAKAAGEGGVAFGFTDTDDFEAQRGKGAPVAAVFPDQGPGEIGTVVLPVTVSLVRGGPHPENARRLYDWLVSPAAEEALSASEYVSIPVRPAAKPGPHAFSQAGFRSAAVDWRKAGEEIDAVLAMAKKALE